MNHWNMLCNLVLSVVHGSIVRVSLTVRDKKNQNTLLGFVHISLEVCKF